MEHVATRRLIDASAVLDPPSRALLNLWLHRGLTDETIAKLAGLGPEALTARRLDIANHLSNELGVPPDVVLSALAVIVKSPQAPGPADPPQDETPAEAAPPEPVGEAPLPSTEHGSRRRTVMAASAVLAAVVIAVVVVLMTSDHRTSRPLAGLQPTTGSVSAAADPPTTVPDHVAQSLKPLSSRAPHASGTVSVSGSGRTRRLDLTISGLPRVTGNHYEVWLYDTIIDSRALGPIKNGVRHLSLALPSDAAKYPAIDVAVQPPDYQYDSGESVLRARNPDR